MKFCRNRLGGKVNNLEINKILDNYSKFIVWGTGEYYNIYKKYLPDQFAYFVDNNTEKWGNILDGKRICSPEKLRNEKRDITLVIVCNSYFDEVQKQLVLYGNFDVIDITYIALALEYKQKKNIKNVYGKQNYVMICAGIHALYLKNGEKKFIDGQLEIFHKWGYNTIEVAPVMYFRFGRAVSEYLIVSENGNAKGVFTIDEVVIAYSSFKAIVIHSLYYNYKILGLLLSKIHCEGNILYYLHDYFCICKNRFLICNKTLCLDEDDKLQCFHCSERGEQIFLQEYHKKLFQDYKVILIAPSLDTKERVEKIYYDIPINVLPHLTYDVLKFKRKEHMKLKIAFLGNMLWHKGREEFCKLTELYYQKYDFYCMGNSEKEIKKDYVTYIPIGLDNSENQITMVQALKKYEIDIAYIGSIWPETYSYTYFEAYEAGCFIITTKKSGNVSRQVRYNQNGYVFDSLNDMVLWLGNEKIVHEAVDKMNDCISNVCNNEKFIYYL